ncbi:hypothetical protein SERLA73DRAFT_166267 [Serpula lacrymans var. lacrymans S7.3]|uniref:TOG domain-containing protein n=1 Tax=Serpula lacrymans var. lacrymans (strain S7.3) TaxID=936435 RepID=F8PNM0_SERL3|nr:hypothetical protein SERLA73DRAFT_166267 [Serpula lacrymans var. lacrymans S7.3]
MSNEQLEKLINQCKNNDVDLKIDAVTKLQAEFESGTEIADPEALITVLKACLRIPNQHLTTATLSALPHFLPLIISRFNAPTQTATRPLSSASSSSSVHSASVDIYTLRQALVAFLPTGGVLERLGDNREKSREKARETLAVLGGLAFRCAPSTSKIKDGKGPETPLMIFERFLREGGLGSKIWRVREQAILTLVQIRRAHHLFPIRPYLPLLVDALEDPDGNVRECSRQSVIELFTGPGVTDAARADLKREMSKKNVRKTIMDNVLSKLIGASGATSTPHSEGSENGDGGKKEYVPPSVLLQTRRPTVGSASGGPPNTVSRAVSHGNVRDISRPASRSAMVSPSLGAVPPLPNDTTSVVEAVFIASSRDMENEFAGMVKPFEGKETEHNWAARDRAVQRVRGMLKGDIQSRYLDVFIACLKDSFIQASLKALASLRTTVSANACSLYSELAVALGPILDPFCETLYSHLLRMAGFTKKIIAQQSQACVSTIMNHTSAQPRTLLPLLWTTLQEKTIQARAFVVAHIKEYLEVHGTRFKNHIESPNGVEILEKSIKKAIIDPNPAVRESARVCFWVFEGIWHDRATVILHALDSIARKQLEKACPNPDALAAVLPPTTPKVKKSSVSAAIAASRAKAKAIATAPPTLRHQATASSHASRAASPTARSPTSPVITVSKTTNGRNSPSPTARSTFSSRTSLSPPTSPRSRILSGTMPRSVSSGPIPNSHARSTSDSTTASIAPEAMRRRTSSPLVPSPPNRSSVLRKAMQTALPASPPSHTSPSSRHTANRTAAVPVPVRQSTVMPTVDVEEESLLLATAIPIPEDSDSDMDESVNLMSFSTPYKVYPPVPSVTSKAPSFSPRSDGSRPTASNALSSTSPSMPSEPIVEDALRARAEQAESAAERLLELVEPESEDLHHSTIPASLLLGNGNGSSTPKPKPANASTIRINMLPPVTPVNKNMAIFRKAAAFKNSPVNNGRTESMLDVLQNQKRESGWWLKRLSAHDQGTVLKTVETDDRVQELESYITALGEGTADVSVLQKLAQLCMSNPASESDATSPLSPGLGLPLSPSPFISVARPLPPFIPDLWTKDKSFSRLLNALFDYLKPSRVTEELEYGLIVLWEILEHQAPFLEGRESDLFSTLLRVRYCSSLNVLEATKTVRDALATRIEPVYGVTTMHASLREFYSEPTTDSSAKSATYAFGIIALGKFILRLPAEILEEELPRLRATLIPALNDYSSLVIREAAAVAIIAAQLVLRDETHLFTLLENLPDDKKNLLTYLFDKHGARDPTDSTTGPSGLEKLEKTMGRLDNSMNTPQKVRVP